ncbi:hypothetical protein HMPREF0239_03047 [Clostridium sp. ATCC BAA-442]|nr:hypothetical protein HMPREF0239_03047 [Clostridium sp. ATCC BAA-442]
MKPQPGKAAACTSGPGVVSWCLARFNLFLRKDQFHPPRGLGIL